MNLVARANILSCISIKKDLSTNEALRILSELSGVKMRDFGYAGLKDKQGSTFQYLSMPKKFESFLANFSHPKLKILETFIHENKLRIGHLKGNSFFYTLKKKFYLVML